MKILIELPTWLGDTVMTTPSIENLVKNFEDIEITLLGSYVSIEALKNHPKVCKTYVLDKKYLAIFSLVKNFSEFDIFFSFRSSFRSRLIKFLVTSKRKYQFNKSFYKSQHQVEKYNDFVNESLNTKFAPDKLKLHVPNLSQDQIKEKSIRFLGINPGASYGSSKQWYPKEFASVAAHLSKQYDIIIFGGSKEINIAKDIEKYLVDSGIRNYENLAGKTSISKLINKIGSLDLFITGDSGPMHIASALQIPTIAIFGPTNDKETSQWKNEKSLIIKKNLDCQPCMKRTCPLLHHNCMKNIHSDDVLNMIKTIN